MKVRDIVREIERIAPIELACTGDPIGLLIGDENTDVDKLLLCLDVTEQAIDCAANMGAQLVVSHHPLIYNRLSRVVSTDPVQRTVADAIKNGISVYAAHTNLDNADRGINDFLAGLAGGKNKQVLFEGNERIGLVVDIDSISLERLANVFSDALSERCFVVGAGDITRLAVISGGGGGEVSYLNTAKAMGAQCLITGDIKHHVALHAHGIGLCLIEMSHFALEYNYLPVLKRLLQDGLDVQIEVLKESNHRRLI